MDFRGARASNAGDDYHELWVTRQAIRLLGDDSELKAIAVEGVSESDASGQPADTWSGVDCTLYFGGTTEADATRVEIVQVKYSTTQPQKRWTAARLAQGGKRTSIFSKLAKAWKGIVESRSRDVHVTTTLVSNQPLQPNLERAVRGVATANATAKKDTPEVRLARVADLDAKELREFTSSLSFKCGAGSRIALEEQVLQSIGKWTDHDLRQVTADLQDFIRRKMMPEATGEPITRESVLAHLGVSDKSALFPCPSEIELVANPVRRAAVTAASAELRESQYVCLHGEAGVGKTTALQEIENDLPPSSIMLKYDCYGAGRYSDPSALRHRTRDAILQLTNELAVRLRLPLLLPPSAHTDYMRQFMRRLESAATTLRKRNSASLIVIAIDAADNAVFAAEGRRPPEPCFVADFVKLTDVPANVRFILTARTGRRDCLQLPPNYKEIQIERFSQPETAEFVSQAWRSAPSTWIEEFHHLSSGSPRVQAAAIAFAGEKPGDAIRRLMPNGKSLKDIFDESFQEAMQKSGAKGTLTSFCAAVIALPRPVPLAILAQTLKERESVILDICRDLAPSIVCRDDLITFADEDLEEFVRAAGAASMDVVQDEVARLMQRLRKDDQYAASHVAAALLAAGHRSELLDLVRREPAPPGEVVSDPALRREAELRRLQLAISVCREAEDVEEALRFILRGAESIQTESALRNLLTENPDLAVRFAPEAVRRLVFLDPRLIEDQGSFLFHDLAAAASSGDAISERQGRRKVQAWLEARDTHRGRVESHQDRWDIEVGDVASVVEATLKLRGAVPAIGDLRRWRPKWVGVEVGLAAPWPLIAEGYGGALSTLVPDELNPVESLYALVPLAMSGQDVDTACIEEGLRTLLRRRRSYDVGAIEFGSSLSLRGRVVGLLLTAAEILVAKGTAVGVAKDVLDAMLDGSLSQIKNHAEYQSAKLDLLLRAHTLREVLNGREPTVADMFDASESEEPGDRRSTPYDRRVRSIADTAIGAYKAVATALAERDATAVDDEVIALGDSWDISGYGVEGLKGRLAAHVGILALVGYDLGRIWQTALRVHGDWQAGLAAPDEDFVARFRLWPALHGPLVESIGTAARRTRPARMAAQEKIDLLTRYSRALLPISPPDASAIFASAVEVVGDLDVEIMEKIDFFQSLVTRCTTSHVPAPRRTAMQFARVVEEAGFRLVGYRRFPWDAAMGALTRLDPPLALALSARWSDEDRVRISTILPALLSAAMSVRGIRSQQASALALFLDFESGLGPEIIGYADSSVLPSLSEEVARDAAVRGASNPQMVLSCIDPEQRGRWTDALRRQVMFQESLPRKTAQESSARETEEADHGLSGHVWRRDELVDTNCLERVVSELAAATVGRQRLMPEAVLNAARSEVKLSDRVAHLDALSKLSGSGVFTGDVPQALIAAVGAWSDSPSVAQWARTTLPGVIFDRFDDFAFYLPHSELLERAFTLAKLDEWKSREIMLRGLEKSVGALPIAAILALVGLVSRSLPQRCAGEIAAWYATHLAERVTGDGQGEGATAERWPKDMEEAVARFLFAHLGDCDLRVRWRAAHAVRRLARTCDFATMDALRGEYFRQEDREFRSENAPFYWLAARLWFVIAFDGVVRDRPEVAVRAADLLLKLHWMTRFRIFWCGRLRKMHV